MIRKVTLALFGGGLLLTGAVLRAEDKPAQAQPSEAEMAEYMATFMKLATPNENHARLGSMIGKWKVTGKFRMAPEAPWTDHNSRAQTDWMLGKRFIQATIQGEPMFGFPTPFEGFSMIGYDNQKKQYISVWADNMSTMVMTAEGRVSEDGKTITFMTHFTDPMTGAKTWMKSEYVLESNDRFLIKMYSPALDGKEFLTMDLTHERV